MTAGSELTEAERCSKPAAFSHSSSAPPSRPGGQGTITSSCRLPAASQCHTIVFFVEIKSLIVLHYPSACTCDSDYGGPTVIEKVRLRRLAQVYAG